MIRTHTSLPALYIPHGGGPCFFMDWTMGPQDTWDRMAHWLEGIPATLPMQPDAIVVISAHFEEEITTITGNPQPTLIYDYYGFPEHTYTLTYPAPGNPALAQKIHTLLTSAGIIARLDPHRGFDHGLFVPLKLIYPKANIPIVQVSLTSDLDPAAHFAVGQALASLRTENILIIGSGMSYHNLGKLFDGSAGTTSDCFDMWLTATVTATDTDLRKQQLMGWSTAPAARDAHPREDHLLPLMVIAGTAADEQAQCVFTDRVMGATVSAYQFG